MSACACDYDDPPSTLYEKRSQKAIKDHRCCECGRRISSGEHYERVFGIWEGDAVVFKTCCRCIAARDWVKAHVPCLCWAHGNLIDDLVNTIEEFKGETVGLEFGFKRHLVKIRKASKWATARTV